MSRFARLPRIALAAAAALGAVTCDGSSAEPDAPFATTLSVYRLDTDGSVSLEADIDLTLLGGDGTRSFAFGQVSIFEPPADDGTIAPPAWTIDDFVINPATWPVDVDGELAFESRRVLVRAHARIADDAPPPGELRVAIREGDTTHVVRALGEAREELEPCEPLSADSTAGSVGGALEWSTSTIPDLVDAPFGLAVDPTGRVWVAGGFTTQPGAGQTLTRVFDATPGGVGSIIELETPRVAIAPGTGSGPTLTYHTYLDDMLVHAIDRRDASLKPVWKHTIDTDKDLAREPLIAASGGHVLVALNVYSALYIDGVPIDGVTPHQEQLVLFDETTGDFIAALGNYGTTEVAPLSSGSFAIVELDPTTQISSVVSLAPDLSVLWSAELDQPATAVATTPDDHVWVALADRVDRFDPAGARVSSIPIRRQGPIVPLPNGDVLVGTNIGVARATAADAWGIGTFAKSPAFWCEITAAWTIAPAPSGAAFVTRPTWTVHGSEDGVALVGKIAL